MSKSVNFIEAVNSGKKMNPVTYSQFFYTPDELMRGEYTLKELVNSEYILEEKKIEITEREFDRINDLLLVTDGFKYPSSYIKDLKRELGFNDEKV